MALKLGGGVRKKRNEEGAEEVAEADSADSGRRAAGQ
jgi:hypothetical protein